MARRPRVRAARALGDASEVLSRAEGSRAPKLFCRELVDPLGATWRLEAGRRASTSRHDFKSSSSLSRYHSRMYVQEVYFSGSVKSRDGAPRGRSDIVLSGVVTVSMTASS